MQDQTNSFKTKRAEKISKGGRTDSAPKGLYDFDKLPDSARVPVATVAAVFGCSVTTTWRRVRDGHIPAPKRMAGTTRWQVGDLRRALAAEAS